MAFVKHFQQLVVARFFLGVAEAGLLPVRTPFINILFNSHTSVRELFSTSRRDTPEGSTPHGWVFHQCIDFRRALW
jgi:hypothetical protein